MAVSSTRVSGINNPYRYPSSSPPSQERDILPRLTQQPRADLPRTGRGDLYSMSDSELRRSRLRSVRNKLLALFWVVIIYLASELAIWGLSRALAPVSLEFFASILGMVVIFAAMTLMRFLYKGADDGYMKYVKSKVDFINANLGLGFPIPIVMLDQSKALDGHDIACVIGNFIVTNVVSWTVVFAVSLTTLAAVMAFRSRAWRRRNNIAGRRITPHAATPPRVQISWHSDSTLTQLNDALNVAPDRSPKRLSEPEQTPMMSRRSSVQSSTQSSRQSSESQWVRNFSIVYPVVLSFSCIFVLGAPIASSTGEERILDGCVLWFVWISTVRLQQIFRSSSMLPRAPRLKSVLATLLNPVLATTLLLTCYTRIKAAIPGADFAQVLQTFSRGTPLYAIWTARTTSATIPSNPTGYFGAGDVALSILECGILIWGFKLYECRRQLFSVAGVLTALISVGAAAGNVFLSTLVGQVMGLSPPEALSFAARSTTLALAKPAIEAVGGNTAVNAALVVSNGIIGQLMYPFVLDKLGVLREGKQAPVPPAVNSDSREMAPPGAQARRTRSKEGMAQPEPEDGEQDSAVTIAAGVTVGINGAAMGVAYLYETRSQAAPYAALAMTVSGVMTVVFTTVEPFRGVLIGLAGI